MSRIPSDQSADYTSWVIPEVKEGQIVKAEKLKNRGPRGQLINVDKNEVIYTSITAAQLEEISNQAYEELREQAQKDGHAQGLSQGHAEGYKAGLAAAEEQVKQQVDGLSAAVTNIYQYLAGQDDEVELALVNVVTSVARAIVRRELLSDSAHVQQVISEALAMLPMDSSNISVHLSEQDYQLLSNQTDIPPQWQLQPDRSLSTGGCRVTSKHSVVEYTMEEQFQQTIDALVTRRFAELAQPDVVGDQD